jgi:hypothetical protein
VRANASALSLQTKGFDVSERAQLTKVIMNYRFPGWLVVTVVLVTMVGVKFLTS